MHILHVTTFLQGGAGRAITALALAQRRAGHHVALALDAGGGDTGYGTYPEYLDALAAGGVVLLDVTSTFRRALDLNTQAARQIAEALAAWPVAIAHTHAAIPSMVARLALGNRGVPIVQTMHGWGIAKSAEHTSTDVALLNLMDAVVTPSAAARATLQALGVARTITVTPYGIEERAARGADVMASIAPLDRARFDDLRGSGLPIVLCIGTIGARKNQRLLIEAMASPEAPPLHAVFIGDGERDALVAEARTRGVEARVHVLGYRPDASRYLPLADLLVLPSRNEGLPLAVLEAFRDGVPVVASAIPEIAEAIEPRETGFLFEPESPAALAVALAEALGVGADRAGLMRQRAMDVFRSRYTLDRMVSDYDRLYAALRTRGVQALAG